MSQELLIFIKHRLVVLCISFHILDPLFWNSVLSETAGVFVVLQGTKPRTGFVILSQWQFTAVFNPHFFSVLWRYIFHMPPWSSHFNLVIQATGFLILFSQICSLQTSYQVTAIIPTAFYTLSSGAPSSPCTSGLSKVDLSSYRKTAVTFLQCFTHSVTSPMGISE